jgi:predicted 3-demethylubiquinone-9 3-methyltransferase (glyoxalase superfamily)
VSPTAPTRVDSLAPFLWFEKDAERAAGFYTQIIAGSRMVAVHRHREGRQRGRAFVVEFELAGVRFFALNGGRAHRLSPAFSISLLCDGQAEVDRLWSTLSRGGKKGPCGWLEDRFGLSWQVVPKRLPELLEGPDREGAARALAAMMAMSKLDIAALEAAYAGDGGTGRARRRA